MTDNGSCHGGTGEEGTEWYAINSKPHQERVAVANLGKLGIETLCPWLKQTKVVRRKRQMVVRPLFPGYLFARFSVKDQYRAVAYARGVRKIVTFGSDPAIVEEELIQSLRYRIQDGYVRIAKPSFHPGEVVRIADGPLSGLEAVFEQELSDQQRAVLLLRALAYRARVVLPLEQVVNL
jgi:transcriptional antiterminator RfaH